MGSNGAHPSTIRPFIGVLVSAICLISVVSVTNAFNARHHGRRDGTNAGVQEGRVKAARFRAVTRPGRDHPIQVTGGSLHSRISRFISGRRATFRRLLVSRRATSDLHHRGRRSARRIQHRSQPKDVNGHRGETISGHLSLVEVIYQSVSVIASLFSHGSRAAR